MKLSFILVIFGAILLFLNVAEASRDSHENRTPGTPRVPKTGTHPTHQHTKKTKKPKTTTAAPSTTGAA
uniref:Uncharacterized protein n=1 Tax=Anopheles farauti TaxID=69004 RepID=A0A182QCZ8_9DIPT